MEILYFIVGTLWVVVAYTLYQNYKLKEQQTGMELELGDIEYLLDRQIGATSDELDDLSDALKTLQERLLDDSYQNITEVNENLELLNKMTNVMNKRFGEANQVTEKQLSVAFSEIQQLKNNIKALNQDPNILDR